VSLDDFKISRTKEKPLWYSYSIELVGIVPLGLARKDKPKELGEPLPASYPQPDTYQNIVNELGQGSSTVKKTKDWVNDAVLALRRTVNAIRNGFSWAQNILNQIDNLLKLVTDLENQVNEYIQSAGTLVSTGLGIYRRLFSIAKFPGSLAKSVLETTNSVMTDLKNTINYTATIKETLGDDYNQIALALNETQRIAAQIVGFGKSQNANSETNVSVDGKNITIYGTKSISIPAETTLERVAVEQYGDATKNTLLATYNGLTDNELTTGMELQIPIISKSVTGLDNLIFSWDQNSSLGTDIQIGTDNELVFSESGDFALILNEANLVQAINLRLNETLGSRLRLTTYGLKNAVGSAGDNSAPIAYIITNLTDTLKQDPRIKTVENIKIRGQGDSLNLSFDAKTINANLNYEGVL
jgi:hypothetical protein